MSRQEAFEQAYAKAHDMPVETFAQYRMGDTYRLPGIAKCWRFWNLALDSVVVELPELDPRMFSCNVIFGHEKARSEATKAIEFHGIKVK